MGHAPSTWSHQKLADPVHDAVQSRVAEAFKVMEVRITTHVANYIVIAPTGATLRHFHAVPSSPRGRETAPRQLTRVTRTSDGFCGWCWHHCSFGVVHPGGASAGGPCSNPPPPSVRDSDAAESFWRASRLQSKGIEAGTLAMMNDVQVDLLIKNNFDRFTQNFNTVEGPQSSVELWATFLLGGGGSS